MASTAWQMTGFGTANLKRGDVPLAQPGPRDLLVRVKAVALNYKDKLIVDGMLLPDLKFPFVPASDAVGEIVAVGSAVSRFKVGQRVLGQVIADWQDGAAPAVLHTRTLGMSLPGVLAEHVPLDEDAAVLAPPSLNDVEAATLPIAALTAWTALVETAPLVPGETVLIQGTGGVALFALQFAAAFGLRAIITSSSDAKLARAKALGAWAGINYTATPAWDEAARALTHGLGVKHVLEMAGGDSMRRSVAALGADGRLSLIGLLGGLEFTLPIVPFLRNRLTVQGISIGSRRAFERMNEVVEARALKPVIEEVYSFADAPRAFAHLARGPFGKVVIKVA